uniref:Uncharacterized protein n=1 Tax=Romanomermis culicivorax TaxID=13658 RepID=A0A915JCX5_ROMCU
MLARSKAIKRRNETEQNAIPQRYRTKGKFSFRSVRLEVTAGSFLGNCSYPFRWKVNFEAERFKLLAICSVLSKKASINDPLRNAMRPVLLTSKQYQGWNYVTGNKKHNIRSMQKELQRTRSLIRPANKSHFQESVCRGEQHCTIAVKYTELSDQTLEKITFTVAWCLISMNI